MPEEVKPRDTMTGNVILCMLKTNVHDHKVYNVRIDELRNLVEALGLKVVDEIVQTRFKQFERYCIGKGKVNELKKLIEEKDVVLVVFYNLLKSSQKLNLIRELGCDVIDRYELTLEIFDEMASDNLSKLQIESARLEKLAPFYKLAANIHFTHDRPFFHSGGEYAFRGQLREITRRQSDIKNEIASLMIEKRRQIENRSKLNYPTVCIAGYYNAGKTSLFNALTGEHKPVSDRPFTTLSSKYQKRYINPDTTVLFVDTIGFVLDLDHRLIKSFQLNFEDIRSADIVILLFEVTDLALTLKLKLSEGISLLRDIGVQLERVIIVFNKLDKVDNQTPVFLEEQLSLSHYDIPWINISVKQRTNLSSLLELISRRIKEIKEKPLTSPESIELKEIDADSCENSENRTLQKLGLKELEKTS
jgi:GTP-binding protein HflX